MIEHELGSLLYKLLKQNELLGGAIADKYGLGMLKLMLANAGVPEQYKTIFYDMPEKALCLDCGANVGLVTDIILFMNGKSICFEPNKTVLKMLYKKYKYNANVTIEDVAVSDKFSSADLCLYGQYDRGANICGFKGELEKPKNLSYAVKTIRLSDYINKLAEDIYLLKLDIEGAEFDVVPDLIKTGAINKCKYVVCETHSRFFEDGHQRMEILRKMISDFKINNLYMEWV